MAAPTPIIPPARVDPNAEYRFVECQDSYVLLLMQRTLDAIEAHGTNGLATEATLAAIKAQTDKMVFTANKLRTTGEDASGGGGGVSTFGDSSSVSGVALTDVSAQIVAADIDRKEVIIYNTTNDKVWLMFGTPAVFDAGTVLLEKSDIWIEDRYRGEITAIMDTGKSGTVRVTDVTV